MLRHTFGKAERLSSRSIIGEIYASKGTARQVQYPLMFVYIRRPLPSRFPAQVLVSVPKKKFRKAHDRQRIKRLIREAWRHHKQDLYTCLEQKNEQMAAAIVYIAAEELPLKDIENAIIRIIPKICREH